MKVKTKVNDRREERKTSIATKVRQNVENEVDQFSSFQFLSWISEGQKKKERRINESPTYIVRMINSVDH
jgi:hypothetical protein